MFFQNDMHTSGKILLLVGFLFILAGVIVYFAGNKFSWFGHLPGDIRVEKENFKMYFPITSMILLSIAASIIWALIRRFLH